MNQNTASGVAGEVQGKARTLRSAGAFLRRHVLLVLLLVVGLAAAGVYLWWTSLPPTPHYVTSAASRGNVTRSIVTTGTVNPVVTVQVGTYVSGVIQALYCDYNTPVKAGQICARIDPRPYQLVVDQNEANLASARAQLKKDQASLAYARSTYQRDLKLNQSGVVSRDTLDAEKAAYEQASAQVALDQAQIKQREAALNAARVNLGYTNIVSPVDGVVVSRNIDVGQTVAASFQTPTLFLIAKDLANMQVDTNVSESDVGGVAVGQKASFTVEAYPGKTFWGEVTQIRKAPITVQNVVTYNVVVGVNNPEQELLPGMTANTRIITAQRKDVLRVPLQALRFSPPGTQAPTTPPAEQQAGQGRVWVLRDGKPVPVSVRTGLTDNTHVEITGGQLHAGDAVIVNAVSGDARAPQRRSPPRF